MVTMHAVLFIGLMLTAGISHGAVPFTADPGDGSSSIAPLLIVVLLALSVSQFRRGRSRMTKAR